MTVDALLQSIPPLAVYGMVGAVVGVESLGIPLPGEIVLVSAALLSSRHELAVNPIGVGAAAVIGAVIGDSTGYAIGRRLGCRCSIGWVGASHTISVPVMSCSLNDCLIAGVRERFSSGVSSRCCGYSPAR
jgi:membrane protein YqaA with SNARE-associated domain